jgi:hypothetical protein
MSLLDANLEDDLESKPVPEGEYNLTIVKAEDVISKAGNPGCNFMVSIDVEEGEATPIFYWMNLPYDGCEYNAGFTRDVKRFLILFGIPHEANGFEVEDAVGATATCFLKTEHSDQYGEQNVIVLPRVDV